MTFSLPLAQIKFINDSPDIAAPSFPAVTYAVGDIHGHCDLLVDLLDKISLHRASVPGRAKIVFLGDYIDRGPDAKGVFEILRSSALREIFDEVICLKGNHEKQLADGLSMFELAEKEAGITEPYEHPWMKSVKKFGMSRESLKKYLAELSLYHDDGVRLFTHAGISKGQSIESVSEYQLLWYRGPVEDTRGRLVVHGHNMTSGQPEMNDHAINIDTGAYLTGRLTCAVFEGASRKPTFITALKQMELDFE